jgi:hypothetical protein
LDDIGNSVRGVHFCKLIARHFSFHAFAPLASIIQGDDSTLVTTTNIGKNWMETTKKLQEKGKEEHGRRVPQDEESEEENIGELSISPHSSKKKTLRRGSSRRNSEIPSTPPPIEDERWDPRRDTRHRNRDEISHSEEEDTLEMLWAAYDNDIDAVRELVSKGVDVNVSDYDGRTALHIAACENNIELIEYLLRAGKF